MLKVARRIGKFVIVWAVVSLVVLDSAWAGRRRWHHAAQRTQGMCYEACELVCSGTPADCDCSSAIEGSPVEAETASPSDVPTAPPVPDDEPQAAAVETPDRPVAPPSAVTPPAVSTAPTPAAAPAAAVAPAPAPASPPAAKPAASTLIEEDDPFAPPATPAPATRTPAAVAPAAPPARPATPAAKPTAPRPTAPEDNDPFAPPSATRPVSPPAAATPARPAANPAADPAADPFKISALTDLPVREWTDDTGLFRVRGRLIAILDDKVRILKETGRTTTVPMTRLSTADRQYVETHKTLTVGQGDPAGDLAAANRNLD